MERTIDYGGMMHRAMQGLIADVLQATAEDGLPGNHHFFITFNTREDGVEMADWLRERYPDEMTIVIQNWFENMRVRRDGFDITLNFGNSPEPLSIPFDALRSFVDPSVEFGLRFEHRDDEDADDDQSDDIAEDADDHPPEAPDDSADRGSAEVVSLDKFRK